MTPRRIQLRRVKGFRIADDVVVCARPGKWGNPHKIVQEPGQTLCEAHEIGMRAFERALIGGLLKISVDDVKRELRGRNLACWCAPHLACHVDVYLRIANE